MPGSVLDTSRLIRHWHRHYSRAEGPRTVSAAEGWAKELTRIHGTNAIVTPVYIEFIAGITNSEQMKLAKHYLAQFEIVDGGKILPEDWREAIRLAERVPRDSRPRQLGDCLIRAIARRLRRRVNTLDKSFPQ